MELTRQLRVSKKMDMRMYVCMDDACFDAVYACMDGWMDAWMDVWMYVFYIWMDG